MSSSKLAAKLVNVLTGSVPFVNVVAQVAEAIAEHVESREFERSVTSALNDLKREVRNVDVKVARRDYRHKMALGRRKLRDLTDWRTDQEWLRITGDARSAFMEASGIAEDLGSSDLLITAELAIAGCWYLEQAQRDVQHTLDGARSHAEREVLSGRRAVVDRYRQVLTLCHAFQSLPPERVIPLDPATNPFPGAALTAHAPLGAPACLLDVQILVNSVEEAGADLVLTNWTPGYVTMRIRPGDGSFGTGDGHPHQVPPGTAGSAALRMTEQRRRAGGGLAVTVELHAHQAPGARYAPFLAFLLPDPWQVPAVDSGQNQYGYYGTPPGQGLPYGEPPAPIPPNLPYPLPPESGYGPPFGDPYWDDY